MCFDGVWVPNKQLSQEHTVTETVLMQASLVVSELIAKKVKPHAEEDFVKECRVFAAELLPTDKAKLFQSVSLS